MIMTLLPLETLNREVRTVYLQWFEDAMEPNLRLVSKKIGIGYSTMKNFKAGTDTTYNNLTKILTFLESKGYKLKEHA